MPRCRRKPPRGYVPDIRQEPAEGANRAELYGVPQAVGLTPSPINVASVLVVKEEVALELSLFDLADVATVRGGLVVVEEVYRHPAMVSNSRPLPLSVRFRSIVPQPPIGVDTEIEMRSAALRHHQVVPSRRSPASRLGWSDNPRWKR